MPESEPMPVGRRIVKAMFVIVFFGLFWKFGGFLMSVLVAKFWGDNSAMWDVYNGVYSIILFMVFYSSVLKVVVPAFMPLFAEEREKGEEQAWRFANTVINLVIPGAVVAALAGYFFAPKLVALFLQGFDAERQAISSRLLQWLSPGVAVLGFALLALAILNSYKVFSYPPAADAAQKLGWAVVLFGLVAVLAMDPRTALERPLGIGFLTGCVLQLIVLLFGLRTKAGMYRPRLPAFGRGRIWLEAGLVGLFAGAGLGWTAWVWHWGEGRSGDSLTLTQKQVSLILTGLLLIGLAYSALLWWRARKRRGIMARFAALAAPLLIGVLFARYRDLMTAAFQSYTLTGVFGVMEFAKKVGNLPIILVAYSLSIAMFPFLCDLAVKRDMDTFGRLLGRTIMVIALFAVPLTVVIVIMREPVMRLVFDRGDWSEFHIYYGGLALAYFSLGLFFYAIENVLMQSFFSLQQVLVPTFLGMATALLHAGFLYLLIQVMGLSYPSEVFLVVALSFPLSRALKNLVLLGVMRARIPMAPLRAGALFCAKLAVVSAGVGVAVWGAHHVLKGAVSVARYKAREVVIDTFNPEPRGWFSHNADDISVVPGQGVGLRGRCLAVRFRRSARRRVRVARELSSVRIGRADRVRMRMAASAPGHFRIALEAKHGRSEHETTIREIRKPVLVEMPVRPAGQGAGHARLVVTDVTPVRPGPKREVVLWLDDITLGPVGREVTVDNFDPAGPEWAASEGCRVGLGELRERGRLEHALRIAGPVHATRDLKRYRLDAMRVFSFKAKSDREREVEISLVDTAGRRFAHTFRLKKSGEQRDRYTAPLAAWKPVEGELDQGDIRAALDPAALGAISFRERGESSAGAGTLWLDNIAFSRPAAGPHFLIFAMRYEIVKLVAAATPGLAGLIVFVILCFALRIEGARLIVDWIKDKGWRKKPAAKGSES